MAALLSCIEITTISLVWEAAITPGNAIHNTFVLCGILAILCFGTSTLTNNYSQVDKLWSIVPMIYAWMLAVDARTTLMAITTTIWSLRLTYNFSRRGGYRWPPWTGDEDYRWSYVQNSEYIPLLRNRFVWVAFNFFFISVYQNVLLLLLVAPSMVANVVASSASFSSVATLGWLDYAAGLLVLFFVGIESMADNQQYKFQTEKYRQVKLGIPAKGEFADGFCQSGIFQLARKPNFAAEQAIWISYYIYSVSATGGYWLNWSAIGWILLVALFQETGKLTEKISSDKYPAYSSYQNRVPRYVPRLFSINGSVKNKSF
jgi:steroid 5-alpha reductase family enzyme